MIELLHMDCMTLMREAPDKKWDLAIVDPPYGIDAPNMQMGSNPNRSRNDGHGSGPGISAAVRLKKKKAFDGRGHFKDSMLNAIDWDIKPTSEYFEQLFRVSKNQIICGGNYFELPPARGVICWDKKQQWENFSQWEMIWTSFDVPAKIFRFSNKGGANQTLKIHPTQKPVELYKYLLAKFAKEGDSILDTHRGSGSLCIACHDYGFDLTSTEKREDYHISSSEWLTRHQKQEKIF